MPNHPPIHRNPRTTLPVDARGLHRHLGRAVRLQPVAQREQPLHRRLELRQMLLAPTAPSRHTHTRGHLLLMHIQRRRALDDRFHLGSFPLDDTIVARGALKTDESDGRARSNSPGCRQDSRAKLTTGSRAPSETGVSRRPADDRRFQSPAGGRHGHGQLKYAIAICGPLLFVILILVRRQVAERAVAPPRVVEGLDVGEDGEPGLVSALPGATTSMARASSSTAAGPRNERSSSERG